jgi:hypothetical protein
VPHGHGGWCGVSCLATPCRRAVARFPAERSPLFRTAQVAYQCRASLG